MDRREQLLEQKCFLRTVTAFEQYSALAQRFITKRRSDWADAIPPAHRELLHYAVNKNGWFKPPASDPPQQQSQNSSSNNNGDDVSPVPQQSAGSASSAAPTHFSHFDLQANCVRENQKFLSCIAQVASTDLFDDYFPAPASGGKQQPRRTPRPRNCGTPSAMDQDKVFSTLRQVVRDWAKEGEGERSAVFDFFFCALEKAFPFEDEATRPLQDGELRDRSHIQVMVPGGGLSRLSVELAARGFSARGNEFSYHMLIAGHYIMNRLYTHDSVTIFPYVDQSINNWSRDSQFQAVTVPDRAAVELFAEAEEKHGIQHGNLSMVAGDFVEVFSKPEERGAWHACASLFFLDTAHNIVEYLKVIHDCLVPGGLLINVGPLLFHWADSLEDVSIELSYDELKRLLHAMGFEIVAEEVVRTAYAQNVNAMKQNLYVCPAFVARKVEPKVVPQGRWEREQGAMYGAAEKELADLVARGNSNNNSKSASKASASAPAATAAAATTNNDDDDDDANVPPSAEKSNSRNGGGGGRRRGKRGGRGNSGGGHGGGGGGGAATSG